MELQNYHKVENISLKQQQKLNTISVIESRISFSSVYLTLRMNITDVCEAYSDCILLMRFIGTNFCKRSYALKQNQKLKSLLLTEDIIL